MNALPVFPSGMQRSGVDPLDGGGGSACLGVRPTGGVVATARGSRGASPAGDHRRTATLRVATQRGVGGELDGAQLGVELEWNAGRGAGKSSGGASMETKTTSGARCHEGDAAGERWCRAKNETGGGAARGARGDQCLARAERAERRRGGPIGKREKGAWAAAVCWARLGRKKTGRPKKNSTFLYLLENFQKDLN
jgi:hypothetical protein